LAEALTGQENHARSVEEYDLAVRLNPKSNAWRLRLASAQKQAGRTEDARQTLQQLLKLDPNYPGAAVLLESLK
jgi:Flp pilus assembly protein TadD